MRDCQTFAQQVSFNIIVPQLTVFAAGIRVLKQEIKRPEEKEAGAQQRKRTNKPLTENILI